MSQRMGTFRVPIEIANLTGDRYERLEAWADTGAFYTVWPKDRLEKLGVQPDESVPFELADGSEVTFDVGWARVRIAGRIQLTKVVFGKPGAEPLLGAFTLEAFRLAVDAVHHRLVPVRAMLKGLAA
jgi:predicted aspartyl protease